MNPASDTTLTSGYALRSVTSVALRCALLAAVAVCGCRSPGHGPHGATARQPSRGSLVRLACLYDQKPWLNLDKASDRDPEGIHYMVFAHTGGGRGMFVDGTFLIEMYQIDRNAAGALERKLVSDWIVPTDTVQRIKSKLWGEGYHLRLRWATKDIAGHEIELVTRFKDRNGNVAVAGIKQFRVPGYSY